MDSVTAKTEEQATTLVNLRQREEIMRRICIYKARREALDSLIEEETARLKLSMQGAGDKKFIVEEGTANFISRRSFKVTDPDKLLRAVPANVIANEFKPTAEFVDAAAHAGKSLKSCISISHNSSFRIDRARTSQAREMQKAIIDETKQAARERVEHLARMMSVSSDSET